METYQLALIAVRVLMAHSPSVAPDGKGHRFFEPCYRRVLCPIHNSLLKVVPSSSVHFEAPRFGNARCLPHIESFFFRQTGLPTDGTLECNFWNTAIQPADEKGPKQQCVEFLRNIRSTRIHGTDGTFTNMTGCIFYGKIIPV